MNRLRLRAEGGFTLIELLVVIAIIGILAAIAIPQFAAYRRRGFDSDAKANLKNMGTAEEAYFTDKNTYTGVLGDLTGSRGYRQSTNISVGFSGVGASAFTITSTVNAGCTSGGGWSFQSTTGLITGTPCS